MEVVEVRTDLQPDLLVELLDLGRGAVLARGRAVGRGALGLGLSLSLSLLMLHLHHRGRRMMVGGHGG